jgi:hypothetical protein
MNRTIRGKEERMRKFVLGTGLLVLSAMLPVPAHAAGSSHAEYVRMYEGTASCTAASCHEGAAVEVAESLHYQQRAVPQFLDGWETGRQAGMMESY